MKLFRILAICCFMLFTAIGAQEALAQVAETTAAVEQNVEMADTLRQDGKIYVVVIVLLTVLAGVFVYLISLDRKVSKLEKQIRN
jgi:uncharacterized membrane protein